MPDTNTDAAQGPYADHAWTYWRAGWKGVLPSRKPATKWPPPNGFTGHEGQIPDAGWIQRWVDERPHSNIFLRLPYGIVGIDVDAYGDKVGSRTLQELEGRLGALPPTVISTSRTGVSGVRLYRCPHTDSWPSRAGPDIEVISYGHRYLVVWPSIHPEGGTYRWVDQRTGEVLNAPPDKANLPELPNAWFVDLQSRASSHTVKADIHDARVREWLDGLRHGEPCDKVAAAHRDALMALDDGSRHDGMVEATMRLVSLGAWGHAGTTNALADLHRRFTRAVTTDGTRSERDALGEWRRAVGGAVAAVINDHPHPADGCVCQVTTLTAAEEDSFWSARPALDHIRTFARARMASPWGVLGVVLTRTIVAMPPHYVLPAIIGGHASLNVFAALVADSGGGKGASESAAADAVDVGKIKSSGVGSGEGLLHQYVVRKKATKELPSGLEQHTKAVLFTAAEVDTLNALHSRNSSTLLAELRKVWMGEELSFAYVDPTKRLTVRRHTYRAGLIVGVQPARAAVLLDDSDGGTPQRFLWLPAYDRDMPDVAPDEPEMWRWTMPTCRSMRVDGRVVVDVCDTAVDTIREHHRKRNRGDGDALDGHALLSRLKVAAALGVLDERLGVNDEDWRLAGIVMDKSDETRGNVLAAISEMKRKTNRAKGLADAEREAVADEAATSRVARVLAGKLQRAGEQSHSKLRKRLTSRDRAQFEAAVEALVDAGLAEVDESSRGVMYRWKGSS